MVQRTKLTDSSFLCNDSENRRVRQQKQRCSFCAGGRLFELYPMPTNPFICPRSVNGCQLRFDRRSSLHGPPRFRKKFEWVMLPQCWLTLTAISFNKNTATSPIEFHQHLKRSEVFVFQRVLRTDDTWC